MFTLVYCLPDKEFSIVTQYVICKRFISTILLVMCLLFFFLFEMFFDGSEVNLWGLVCVFFPPSYC